MTRLTEALERARMMPSTVAPLDVEPPAKTGDDVLRIWHFDDDHPEVDQLTPPVLPSRPVEKQPDLRSVGLQFSADAVNKLVIGEGADHGVVEQYRRLAAVLHHAQTQRRARSVMIPSAVAAEGKTLTATNLALTLSHSFERRVLLIDADLRRPSVHEVFRLPNDHGLVDNLSRAAAGRATQVVHQPVIVGQPEDLVHAGPPQVGIDEQYAPFERVAEREGQVCRGQGFAFGRDCARDH